MFFTALMALLVFACNENENRSSLTVDDPESGNWGGIPEMVMTLEEVLNTPGTYRFSGPENRVYVMKDGAMSNSQDDYDTSTDVEVIYPDNLTDIVILSDGREYVLDAEVWHEITQPCGLNTWYETTDEFYQLCSQNSYRCCTKITRWSCLSPIPIKISETVSCGTCRAFDPWHPHYPCGFQR